MWNRRSPYGAESVAERRSLHCWTSWLPLDKENHWQSTPAVAPGGWLQWALPNPLICCSQWPLDSATQKWFGNQKFPGGHPLNYLWSQTLLNINDYITGTLSKAIFFLVYRSQNFLCPSISRSVPFQGRGLYGGFCRTWTWTFRYQLLGPNNWYLKVHRHSVSCQDKVKAHTATQGWFCGSSQISISWPDSLQLGNRPQNDCCTFVLGLYVTLIHHFPAFVNSYHSFNAIRNGPENHYYSLYLKTVLGQIISFYLSNIFLLNFGFSYMLINWHCAPNLHH